MLFKLQPCPATNACTSTANHSSSQDRPVRSESSEPTSTETETASSPHGKIFANISKQLFDWLGDLLSGIGDAFGSAIHWLWDQISNGIFDIFFRWIYETVFGAIADFFTMIGKIY